MSIRKVKPYGNYDFIQKTIDIDRKIPFLADLNDLAEHEKEFSKREYLSIYQSFTEAKIWNDASWEERQILSPLLNFYYDHNWCPVLIYPRFEPLVSETQSFRFEEDEILGELHRHLAVRGMSDDEIGDFIEKVLSFCDNYDMNEDDILYNLNNLGWNPIFGVRVIDFGLTNEMIEKFYSKKEEENV